MATIEGLPKHGQQHRSYRSFIRAILFLHLLFALITTASNANLAMGKDASSKRMIKTRKEPEIHLLDAITKLPTQEPRPKHKKQKKH